MTPDFDIALLDDNLLGQFLENKKTWEYWLTVARARYGLKPARGIGRGLSNSRDAQSGPLSHQKKIG